MNAKPSFFAELQRRHVYKVGAMYCVAGWLLVQVVTQVLPVFDVSALGQRIMVLIVVAGFPAALVLAWLFDLTPQGIVRTADAPATGESPAAARERQGVERRLNYLLGALLLLGILYVALDHTVLRRPAASAAEGAAARSIAVLPFDNLSRDPDNAYFAEGIQDQVLTQLAKIGALKVISRTSTQQYAAKPGTVAEIARQLGVANILEGSVQKAGDAVRINVQLIRADGDSHLWAETYDRKLDNIFGVESEVAQAIALALNARLTGAEKQELADRPTVDPGAWDAYLHATVLFMRGGELRTDVEEAVRSLQDAVRRDPDFAQGWALLAEIKASESIENWDVSEAGRAQALQAVRQAQRLRPDAVETQAAEAYYHFWVERDYEAARRGFELARHKAPGNADIISALAFLARRQGRWQESIELFDQALTLDPRNIEYLCQAGRTAAGLRDFPLAMRYFERCQDVAPQLASTLSNKAWLHQAQGQLDAAEPLLAGIDPDPGDVPTILTVASQKLFRRRYPEGIALLQACLDHLDASRRRERAFLEFHLGEFQRLSGQAAAARTTYRHAQDDAAAVLAGQPGNGDLLNLQALVHVRLGETTAAMAYSRQALQAVPAGGDALSLAAAKDTLARVLAGSGNPGAAIDILEHLLAGPSLSDSEFEPLLTAATLRLDPEWDGLRRDPRFQRLAGET
ncbi:MAG: tetratricopeptide repeat protein [Nevskiales bacterium]